MKGLDAITRVSMFLADQVPGDAFSRWTQDELFYAFKYALHQVAVADPSTFNGIVNVTLQAGSAQQLPPCCNRLRDTVGNYRMTSRLANRLVNRKQVCPPNSNAPYKLRSISYDADTAQGMMFVQPPVPESAAGTSVQVICDLVPNPSNLDEDVRLTGPQEGCIIDLMLFYICSGENESASLAQTAERHFRSAMTFLGLDVKNDAAAYQQKVQEARSGITA